MILGRNAIQLDKRFLLFACHTLVSRKALTDACIGITRSSIRAFGEFGQFERRGRIAGRELIDITDFASAYACGKWRHVGGIVRSNCASEQVLESARARRRRKRNGAHGVRCIRPRHGGR